MQLFQRRAQVLEVFRLDGVDAREDHGLHFFESVDGLVARTGDVCNRITHLNLARCLDARNDVAHVARAQFVARHHVHLQYAHFVGIVFLARVEELHLVALADDTVLYLEVSHDATE